jgi:hypothetical protein
METLFLICAVGGGTVMVLQFLLMLIGIGGHDMAGADHDFGADVGHDLGGDAGDDFGGDVHGGDFHPGDVHAGDADASTDHAAHQLDHHSTVGIFKVISFRAMVAALAFFGLGGMAAQSAGYSGTAALGVALACGAAAIALVYWLMKLIYSMNAEGTARIEQTLGKFGTVYLRIPPHESNAGKIQINLQNQTMEYLATTAGPEIPTGTAVEVIGIVSPTTLSVARAEGLEREPS